MTNLDYVLLILHFIGLALGFSVSFSNLVMTGLISKTDPAEKPVLLRFPPLMSNLGRLGIVLLWITGVAMIYTRWDGDWALGWPFYAKIIAVVLLTITVGILTAMEQRMKKGETEILPQMQNLGKFATLCALVALVFAVLRFG
ncbi:MAG TPA: hypothetical protein VNI20_05075 [Fimbriimonadaceae bacterium]|nr:hypothetical protein [Fimbriimonadaceae bacterium]